MAAATHEATIEVLTAEVRVLMVGSRQVTLSVAKQLDYVPLSQIDAFGRVRFTDREVIIGRSRSGGTLVLARFDRSPHRIPWISGEDLDPVIDTLPVVCDRNRPSRGAYRLKYDGRSIDLSETAASKCGKHSSISGEECEFWQVNGNQKALQAAIELWDAACAVHDRAAALPLIVLAGLR